MKSLTIKNHITRWDNNVPFNPAGFMAFLFDNAKIGCCKVIDLAGSAFVLAKNEVPLF